MSRMNQVMQIGEIEGDTFYYIEDYAYTYLKKQKGKEKTKYFLYGEKEEEHKQTKLYIYGIAEKPKMEQTYFKEYYPLGFLKIKDDEKFWINLKGQEERMTGFYVFYASNQAMQEYLVDHREEEKEDKPQEQAKRQLVGESLPMKETWISNRKIKKQRHNSESKNDRFLFSVGGIMVASIMLFALTSTNGQKKIEIFKQVISHAVTGKMNETDENSLIIEEKEAVGINDKADMDRNEEFIQQNQETSSTTENSLEVNESIKEEQTAESIEENKEEVVNTKETDVKTNYEEYIVKEGDTLAAICKTRYGSLVQLEEICALNNIKNADYIAPGQKIYLP